MTMSRLAASLMVPAALALPRTGVAASIEAQVRDSQGNPGIALLRDVPSGNYDVHAWHPQQRAASSSRAFALDPGSANAVAFTLDIVPRKAKYKPPLDRLKY